MAEFSCSSLPRIASILSCALALSGCCIVRQPLRSPNWITPTHTVPGARACTRCDKEMRNQMLELKRRLKEQRLCCGNNQACRAALRKSGTEAWDRSLETYELVHTNVPVGDKIDSLKANQAAIDSLHVCPSGMSAAAK
jgi:hypothetical protein